MTSCTVSKFFRSRVKKNKRNDFEEELKTFGEWGVCELMSTKHKFAFNLILISPENYKVVWTAFVYINY